MRVEAPHFVAGFVSENEEVVVTAPIISYMMGWSNDKARSYIKKKGWEAFIVPEYPSAKE